jgi:conjugative transfer region protein (TIGR03750 family)
MHSRPSSRHLSHDFSAWQGLSLRELFYLVIGATIVNTLLFLILGFVLGYPVVFGCMGFLLGFILAITVYPKILARLKSGKPYGYLMKRALLGLSRLGLMKSPWVNHTGAWRTARSLGETDV